jgi:hypothetical protein
MPDELDTGAYDLPYLPALAGDHLVLVGLGVLVLVRMWRRRARIHPVA